MTNRQIFLLECVLLASLAPLLTGCSTGRQSAAWDSLASLWRTGEEVDKAALPPTLKYLRVMVAGKSLLMVLGYEDSDRYGRPVQVWYSAEGDVLRTQSGRLVGLEGAAPVVWRNVELPADLPGWPAQGAENGFMRRLDEMPGYRWALQDQMLVRRIEPPSSGTTLKGLSADSLAWYEEWDQAGRLPVARYAVSSAGPNPVYTEQCLTATYCLSWQVWPPSTVPPPKAVDLAH